MKPQWTRFLLPWVAASHRSGWALKIWNVDESIEGIPRTVDYLEQRRCAPRYLFTTRSEVWVHQCTSGDQNDSLCYCWSIWLWWTQAHSQLPPPTTPRWYFVSYCQAEPSIQHCVGLGFKQKISATKCSFESLSLLEKCSSKLSFPWFIPCTQVNHSSWLPTQHVADLEKNYSLETKWYKLHENKRTGWQHAYLQINHKSTFEYFEYMFSAYQDHDELNGRFRVSAEEFQTISRSMTAGAAGELQHPLLSICIWYKIYLWLLRLQCCISRTTPAENSKPQYFWVIPEPVLPNCRQVLELICLCDCIQEFSSPIRGLLYYTLSTVSFSCLLPVVLSGVVFVFFCFSNTENILVCLSIQLTFLCTKTDIHLSQRMAYQMLLIRIASEGSVPDVPGAKLVLLRSLCFPVSEQDALQIEILQTARYGSESPMSLHHIASLQPRVKLDSSVIILPRF